MKTLALVLAVMLPLSCSPSTDAELMAELERLGLEWQVLTPLPELMDLDERELRRLCDRLTRWLRDFDRLDDALRKQVFSGDAVPPETWDEQRLLSRQMRDAALAAKRQAC